MYIQWGFCTLLYHLYFLIQLCLSQIKKIKRLNIWFILIRDLFLSNRLKIKNVGIVCLFYNLFDNYVEDLFCDLSIVDLVKYDASFSCYYLLHGKYACILIHCILFHLVCLH